MGLESATYIADLNASNPDGADAKSQGDNHLRLVKAVLLASFPGVTGPVYLDQAQSDVASATTPDITAPTTRFIRITGTTTITGFATATAGVRRVLRFAAALTFTYNATSLILPGAANITTAANDTCEMVSLGSGNWLCLWYKKQDGGAITFGSISALTALTAPAVGDLLPIYDLSATANRSIALSDFFKVIAALTQKSSLVAADKVVLADSAASDASKYSLISDLPPDNKTVLNSQTANYTVVDGDQGKTVEMSNASARTITIPPNATTAFATGTYFNFVRMGAGSVTIVAGAGVTIRNAQAGLLLRAQYSVATIYKRDTNEWVIGGDLSA